MFVVYVSFDFWVYANMLYMAAALIIVCVQFFFSFLFASKYSKEFFQFFRCCCERICDLPQFNLFMLFIHIFFYIIQKYKTIVHVSIHLIYPHPVYKTFKRHSFFFSFFSLSLAITYSLLLTK